MLPRGSDIVLSANEGEKKTRSVEVRQKSNKYIHMRYLNQKMKHKNKRSIVFAIESFFTFE